jgi:NitT/TauT family transport system ATP-binding protein
MQKRSLVEVQHSQASADRVPADTELVRLSNVSIGYERSDGRCVLSGIDLVAGAGQFICIVGPSGCGKSTLLKAIAGFVALRSGSIKIRGEEVSGPGSDRGMVFQEFVLFPWLTVAENILFGDRVSKGTYKEREANVVHYLSLVGLTEFKDYHPSQLSGGMKQRVALARAWANQPAVLLMDEPFGALDARTRQELQDTLLQIFEKERTLCFFVTHDTEEAVYLADRIVIMSSQGRIRESVEVPLPRPRDRYARAVVDVVKRVTEIAWEAE